MDLWDVTVPMNRNVMFGSLSGSKLGIWVYMEKVNSHCHMMKINTMLYWNTHTMSIRQSNGSDYYVAGLASPDGRHLTMMPHLERSCFPWQNAYYPADRIKNDQITPWMEAFVNARKWIEMNKNKNDLLYLLKAVSHTDYRFFVYNRFWYVREITNFVRILPP